MLAYLLLPRFQASTIGLVMRIVGEIGIEVRLCRRVLPDVLSHCVTLLLG